MVEHDETRLAVVVEQPSRYLCVVSQLLVVEQAEDRLDTVAPGPGDPFGDGGLCHGFAGVAGTARSVQNSRNYFTHKGFFGLKPFDMITVRSLTNFISNQDAKLRMAHPTPCLLCTL